MKIAIVFPGQGAQKNGMGKEFYETNDVFRDAFDACDAQTNVDLKAACFEGVGLESTRITQPALYAVSIATYKMLESLNISGDIFAGLSLGEYAALAACNVLDYKKTTALVSIRGELMQSAVPQGVASMTAVIGLAAEDIQKAIEGIDNVWIANRNAPTQTVIGGTLVALDVADVAVKEAGAPIVKRLNVAGPFHTPLLKEAGDKLKDALDGYDVNTTDKTVYANVTGKAYNATDDVKDMLAKQVSTSVYWSDILKSIVNDADVIIECGPGNVLSKLAKKEIKQSGSDTKVFSANAMKTIAEIKEYING